MLIVWFFANKKLAQFAVRCALPPRRSESPVCATDNKPSCVLHLLGWFIGLRGFSSLERRPEFWVLQTCLQRNVYAGQEATVRTGHGTDWFHIGKGVCQGYILSPCLFNIYAEYTMRNVGWMKHKLELRFPEKISITSDTQKTPPLWQKVRN